MLFKRIKLNDIELIEFEFHSKIYINFIKYKKKVKIWRI